MSYAALGYNGFQGHGGGPSQGQFRGDRSQGQFRGGRGRGRRWYRGGRSNRRPSRRSNTDPYAQYRAKTPLAYHQGFNSDDLTEKVSLKINFANDTSQKFTFTAISLTNKEVTLQTVQRFMQWCNKHDHTPTEKFDYFEQLLIGISHTNWQTALIGVDMTTDDGFNTALHNFLRSYFTSKAYEHFTDYIKHVPKPINMEADAYVNRVQALYLYAQYLPGNPNFGQPIPEATIKTALHKSVPSTWRDTLESQNRDASDMPFHQLTQFYRSMKSLDDNKRASNSSNSSHNNGNKHPKYNTGQCFEPCPIPKHRNLQGRGFHTWDQCILNPDSANYRGGQRNGAPGQSFSPDQYLSDNAMASGGQIGFPRSTDMYYYGGLPGSGRGIYGSILLPDDLSHRQDCCPICLDPVQPPTLELSCHHVFCTPSTSNWIVQQQNQQQRRLWRVRRCCQWREQMGWMALSCLSTSSLIDHVWSTENQGWSQVSTRRGDTTAIRLSHRM